MKCPICQSEIEDNSLYCPKCGARILANQTPQSAPAVHTMDLYGRPIVFKNYGKYYSRYIFVVSLVLMILGAIGWIIGLASSSSLAGQLALYGSYLTPTELALYNRLLTLMRGENWLILGGFATTLILMIFAVVLKRRTQDSNNEASVLKQVKIQLGAAIAALVLAVAFVIYEAIAIDTIPSIVAALGLDLATGPTALIIPAAKAGLLIPAVVISFKSLGLNKNKTTSQLPNI